MAASDVPAARTAYQQAAELARRIGSPEALARAGLGLGLEFTSMIVDPVQVGHARRGAGGPGRGRQPAAGAGAGRAGQDAGVHPAGRAAPGAQRGCGADGQAPGRARRRWPRCCSAATWPSGVPSEPKSAGERLAIATEAVGLAEQIGDRAMALRGRGLRRIDLLELGDLAGYDADLAAAERAAEQLRQLRYRWQLPLAHATRALLAGRFAQAEELIEQGLVGWPAGRRPGPGALLHRGHRDAPTHARPLRRADRAVPGCCRPFPGHGGVPGGRGIGAGRGRPRRPGPGRAGAAGRRGPGCRAQGPGVEFHPGHPGAGLLPPRRVRHRRHAVSAAGAVRRPQHRHRPRRRHLPGSGGLLPGAAGPHPQPSPSRHCATFSRQPRSPAACRPARWWR